MLVISRRPGEAFTVGSSRIQIVEIRGGKVFVGIDAPREIPVVREELYQRAATASAPAQGDNGKRGAA